MKPDSIPCPYSIKKKISDLWNSEFWESLLKIVYKHKLENH